MTWPVGFRGLTRRGIAVAGVLLIGLMLSGPVTQGQRLKRVVERPELASLRIEGNVNLSTAELQLAIATVPTRSRSFFSIPLPFLPRKRVVLDRAELDRDLLRIRVLYWKRGWRSAQVTPVIVNRDEGVVELTLKVVEGPATTIGELRLGDLDTLLVRYGLRKLVIVEPGQPLDLIKLDSIGARIAMQLDKEGYGDMTVTPVAVVDTNSPRATVTLEVAKLYRTYVESVRVEGTERYDPRVVANTMQVKAGRPYSRVGMAESQRALYEAGFFKRAVVRVEPGSTDALKRLIAQVEELPTKAFRVTGGASTVDFFQVDARYTDANFRATAGRLTLQTTVGNLLADQLVGKFPFNNVLANTNSQNSPRFLQPTFQVNADVRRRWLSDSRNQTGLSLFGYRRSSPGVFVDQGGGVGASFTRNVTRTIPISAQYRLEFTNVAAEDAYYCANFGACDQISLALLRGTRRLAPLSITASSDRRDDPIGPTRGFAWRTELEFASAWTGSQLGYSRAEVEGAKYFHVSDRLTLAVHGRAGIVRGRVRRDGQVAQAEILPRKRFYAGGARSVRGYGENQLGPRVLVIARSAFQPDSATFQRLLADTVSNPRLPCTFRIELPDCPTAKAGAGRLPSDFVDGDFLPKPLGAETMLEGSVEVRYKLRGPLSVAAFIDAGSVGAQFGGTAAAFTPGIGVRFLSPVGPIRVDLGYNPRLTEELRVITELVPSDAGWLAARGIEQREGLFQINSTRSFNPANGTGLGGIFNRLTLHLSIGEAF